jgi:hypothetical protein
LEEYKGKSTLNTLKEDEILWKIIELNFLAAVKI